MSKKVLKIIGTLLMTISIVFIIRKLLKYNLADFQLSIIKTHLVRFVILCFLLSGIIIFSGILFAQILHVICGKEITKIPIMYIYCKTNLYKYIPSNVMQYIGRNQIALDNKYISHQQVITTTIIEILFLIVTSLLTALLFSYRYAIEIVLENNLQIKLLILSIAAILIFFLAILLLKKKYKSYWEKIFTIVKKISRKIPTLEISYLFIYILNGLFFLMVLSTFSGEQTISPRTAMEIIGLYALSWVLGYITPGAPGGLGIRESIMCLFLADSFTENIILSAVLVHRVLTVFGDIIAFIISLLLNRKSSGGKKYVLNNRNTDL